MPDDRIRVLVFSKGLGRGGTEQLIATSARYWNRNDFDYRVGYLLPHKDDLVPVLEALEVPVRCFHAQAPGGWALELRRSCRDAGVDVLHLHAPHPAALARPMIGSGSATRIVYTEHGPWDVYKRRTYWGNALTYATNDHVFAVSEAVRESIRYPSPLRPLPMPPRETLYHGFDPAILDAATSDGESLRDEFNLPADAVVITMVANFRPQKRHDVFLRAAAEAVHVNPRIRFLLVGGGPLLGEMQALASKLGVDDAVDFAGYRSDVPRLVAQSDVFALSSGYEGLPIALLEALALGKPTVVTDVVGTREAVRGEGDGGLVVPPGDSLALAKAFLRISEDEGERARLGTAARSRSAGFSIEHAVQRQETVYRQLGGT